MRVFKSVESCANNTLMKYLGLLASRVEGKLSDFFLIDLHLCLMAGHITLLTTSPCLQHVFRKSNMGTPNFFLDFRQWKPKRVRAQNLICNTSQKCSTCSKSQCRMLFALLETTVVWADAWLTKPELVLLGAPVIGTTWQSKIFPSHQLRSACQRFMTLWKPLGNLTSLRNWENTPSYVQNARTLHGGPLQLTDLTLRRIAAIVGKFRWGHAYYAHESTGARSEYDSGRVLSGWVVVSSLLLLKRSSKT